MLNQISFLPRRDHYSVSPCRDPYAQRTTVKTTHSSLFPRGDILRMFLPITLDTTNTHHNHATWIVTASSHSHNTHTTPQVTSIAHACFMPHTHKACILQLHTTHKYITHCNIHYTHNTFIPHNIPYTFLLQHPYILQASKDLPKARAIPWPWERPPVCDLLSCKRVVPSFNVCCSLV